MSRDRVGASVERALTYSWLSYRALFFWASPGAYVASLVVLPVFLGLLFVLVNHTAQADVTRPVVGGALLAANNAVMYGLVLVVMEERWLGTVDLWFAAPLSLLRSLLAKAIVHLANGLVTGATSFVTLAALTGVRVPGVVAGQLLLCALAVSVSATGIGLFTTSVAIWGRDVLAAPNAMRSLILLSSSAMVDASVLGRPLERLGWLLPVRHAVTAAVRLLNGDGLSVHLLAEEVLVGGVWGLIGYIVLRLAVLRLRRTGRLGMT